MQCRLRAAGFQSPTGCHCFSSPGRGGKRREGRGVEGEGRRDRGGEEGGKGGVRREAQGREGRAWGILSIAP